jgi:hypothetical protein
MQLLHKIYCSYQKIKPKYYLSIYNLVHEIYGHVIPTWSEALQIHEHCLNLTP